ncbi:hypothetical protein BJ170DRAFT_609138 [Xylariales sp. AK1849]|nr:hypothetical protein BJ170DRAFT_609138 [Xylariales sp. AK1849]
MANRLILSLLAVKTGHGRTWSWRHPIPWTASLAELHGSSLASRQVTLEPEKMLDMHARYQSISGGKRDYFFFPGSARPVTLFTHQPRKYYWWSQLLSHTGRSIRFSYADGSKTQYGDQIAQKALCFLSDISPSSRFLHHLAPGRVLLAREE